MNRDITAQFIKMLTNLDHCLAKAEAHAAAKQFNVDNFFGDRLIVDMLPLSKQVLICCDSARAVVATASHSEQPAMGDDPKTMADPSAICKASWTRTTASTPAAVTCPTGRAARGWMAIPASMSTAFPTSTFTSPWPTPCCAAPGSISASATIWAGSTCNKRCPLGANR